MQNEIALVQSRTFWSAALALVAVVAAQFHWSSVLGFATDPDTVNVILQIVTVLSVVLAGVFRAAATAKVTSILPPGGAAKALGVLVCLPPGLKALAVASALLGLGACAKDMAALNTANNDLATLSSGSLPKACQIISVAEGYFANVKSAVSASVQQREAQAAAAAGAICASPPSNVLTAFEDLFNAWLAIQAATTVPS